MPKWQKNRQVRHVTVHFPGNPMFAVQPRPHPQSSVPLDVEYHEPARFKIRASGEVTMSQIEAVAAQLLAHPGLADGSDMIVEADEVEQVPPTADLRAVASMMVPMLHRGLGALAIVSKKPFIYGVARVFAVFAETVGAKVYAFREPDDANRWLALRRMKADGRVS